MKIIATILITLHILKVVNLSHIIKISIFYETFCPNTKKFFDNQLIPIYDYIEYNTTLEYIPFGNSSSITINGTETFKCKHGRKACQGNMLDSCAINMLNNTRDQTAFIVCQMEDLDKDRTGSSCIEGIEPGLSPQLQECINGPLGRELQLQAEAATLLYGNPQLKFIPTIVYNDIFNETLQNRFRKEFANVYCELIENQIPFCKDRKVGTTEVFYKMFKVFGL